MPNQDYLDLLERQAEAQELANLIAIVSNPVTLNNLEGIEQEHILNEIKARTEKVVGKAIKPVNTDENVNDLNSTVIR